MSIFLVGNFSISVTGGNTVIVNFSNQIPVVELNNKRIEFEHNNILLNPVQTKSLRDALTKIVDVLEKNIGEIKTFKPNEIIFKKDDVGGMG